MDNKEIWESQIIDRGTSEGAGVATTPCQEDLPPIREQFTPVTNLYQM